MLRDALSDRPVHRFARQSTTPYWRHADAGYEAAIRCAREKGLDLPGLAG
jgi:urocanate hydratase